MFMLHCSIVERRILWRFLLDRKIKSGNEDWCMVGDFNEVLRREERIGECFINSSRGMVNFRGFMESM